ncbi:elongation factor Ts [Patescibacteria group bacterium]|nr:elongation factor Ts [Patescibacteria group bacterium]MBU4057479.1 elongation factor Ts [Patescibacteria group bacterium]MBU4115962.1 elongation factor Ts [Patescibacteria group bacterium]
MITTELIKELRDKTGVSVMQCKKALESVGGNIDKALIILKKKGSEIALKKSDRKIGAGLISTYVHTNGTVGAMIEMVCETDFVARNQEFKNLAYDIAMQVVAMNPTFLNLEEITEKDKKIATEVFKEEVKDKPVELQEKILEGKLNSYFKDKVLLEQSFIKNPDSTIRTLIESATQKFGEKIEITKFTRFSVLEK